MSDGRQDEKNESSEKKTESNQEQPSQPSLQRKRPMVGTPIGQTSNQNVQSSTSSAAQQPTQTSQAVRPAVGTPVGKPVVGRPVVGSPVGAQPSATVAPKPEAAPTQSSPVSKPATPPKRVESKAEISRRNFIKGLAVLGGIVAVGQFVALGPYLQGSVGQSSITSQVIQDAKTGTTLKTTTSLISSPNSWTTFVYPRTGNPNLDNDTFRQCVIIHLPKGWSAGQYGTVDPISGDSFVALSRVCVHLWCLWSYVPIDDRGICPCHGSQYIPGGKAGTSQANEPGLAVEGPASLQTPPNNQLPVITLKIAADGTISATGVVGQIGCGQKC